MISGSTKVDELKSIEEVNTQVDNWRKTARHLQENLCDPGAARELLDKARKHRENNGLWCTVENADTHIDLARKISTENRRSEAEFRLRISLRINTRMEYGHEHIGDLLHYIGVLADRQKKRREAEALYRSAIDTYKFTKFNGNNVELAHKNLSFNLAEPRPLGRELR